MDTKWLTLMMVGIVTAFMSAVAVESYNKNQCRQSFAQSTKTADEIVKICGK